MELQPATSTQQLETDSVRVTRWDFPPGTETGDHRHEFDYVVVPVTDGTLTIVMPDGEAVEAALTIGGTYERRAGVAHNVTNQSDQIVSFVEIELLEHAD